MLVFVLIRVVPGDPGRNALGPDASAEQVRAWNAAHGLDGAAVEQYLAWVGRFLTGDWGHSAIYGVPVRALVLERATNSIALAMLAFLLLVPIAVTIGVLQARREGSWADRGLTIALMTLTAVPEFVIGVLLLVVFALILPVFPIQSAVGAGDGFWSHVRAMVLPAFTLALGSLAVVARTTRSSVSETMHSTFFRAAVIKGVRPGRLFRAHVARNSLIPPISVLAVSFGTLIGGSAIVETLFGYPGIGELLVTATRRKDTAVLAAGTLLVGVVSLVTVMVADVVFMRMDPRVRFRGVRG